MIDEKTVEIVAVLKIILIEFGHEDRQTLER
jgi:hypothetical protein